MQTKFPGHPSNTMIIQSTEADNVYENYLQGTQKSKQIKSKKLNPKVAKSNKLLVYENLMLNTGQADDIYQNL